MPPSRDGSPARDARILAEYPGCADPAALAESLGISPKWLRNRAAQLGVRRGHYSMRSRRMAAVGAAGEAELDATEARIRAEFGTCPSVPAMAASLGMRAKSLYDLARRLGVPRDPAVTRAIQAKVLARANAASVAARLADGAFQLDVTKLEPVPVERPRAEEARRARAWQLAQPLLPGGLASWRSLRRAGWTEAAVRHLLAESASWFRSTEWDGGLVDVLLTEAGKEEFGAHAPLGYAAHHKDRKARAG
jgi:hypothetical protein